MGNIADINSKFYGKYCKYKLKKIGCWLSSVARRGSRRENEIPKIRKKSGKNQKKILKKKS